MYNPLSSFYSKLSLVHCLKDLGTEGDSILQRELNCPFGQIIRVMTEMWMQALEHRTRELFTECLISLGAISKDMELFTVSRKDLEELVGD